MKCNTFRDAARIGLIVALPLGGGLAGMPARALTLEEAESIERGFQLFTEETFGGNGRTCATCHIPSSNYTISPTDIAGLSADEQALVFADNVPGLENRTLVEQLTLFNIGPGSADGTRPPGPFRSSMTVGALALTTVFAGRGGNAIRLGWGSDGSPNNEFDFTNDDDGSIRAFAVGAVFQHNTLSLERLPGADFRVPTDAELDDLDAFQKWLGRRNEFDVSQMVFADARATAGRDLFNSDETSCKNCHFNGGAHLEPIPGAPPVPPVSSNLDIDTNIDNLSRRLSRAVGVTIPVDDGNGTGQFNSQPLIEAVRKDVFNHNSSFSTNIETAARHYFTAVFNNSPGGVTVTNAEGGQVNNLQSIGGNRGLNNLGAFIRTLSAFYSLVDCERLVDETIERIDLGASTDLPVLHCQFALDDVTQVLSGARVTPTLYPDVQGQIAGVKTQLDDAAGNADRLALQGVIGALQSLRNALLTTPELP